MSRKTTVGWIVPLALAAAVVPVPLRAAKVVFASSTLQTTEGDHSTVIVQLKECPSRELLGDAHVRVTARSRTAEEGEDFFAYRDLRFGAIETADGSERTFRLQEVPLVVSDDQDREAEETFELVLELVGEPTLDCGNGPEPIELGEPMLVAIADRVAPPKPAEAVTRLAQAEPAERPAATKRARRGARKASGQRVAKKSSKRAARRAASKASGTAVVQKSSKRAARRAASEASGTAVVQKSSKRAARRAASEASGTAVAQKSSKRAARRATRELSSPKVDPRSERRADRSKPETAVRVASVEPTTSRDRTPRKKQRQPRTDEKPDPAAQAERARVRTETASAAGEQSRPLRLASADPAPRPAVTRTESRSGRRAAADRERLAKHQRDLAAKALRRRNAATRRQLASARRAARRNTPPPRKVALAVAPPAPVRRARKRQDEPSRHQRRIESRADSDRLARRSKQSTVPAVERTAPGARVTSGVRAPLRTPAPPEGLSRSKVELQLAEVRSRLAPLVESPGSRAAEVLGGRPASRQVPADPCRNGGSSTELEVGFHEPSVRSVEGGLDVRTQVSNPYDVPLLVRVRVTLSKQLRPVGHGVNGAKLAPHGREEVRFLYPASDDAALYNVSFAADIQPVCASTGGGKALSE